MPLLILTYSMMGFLICNYEPFWQENQYMVSDTKVTVKACVSLVLHYRSFYGVPVTKWSVTSFRVNNST